MASIVLSMLVVSAGCSGGEEPTGDEGGEDNPMVGSGGFGSPGAGGSDVASGGASGGAAASGGGPTGGSVSTLTGGTGPGTGGLVGSGGVDTAAGGEPPMVDCSAIESQGNWELCEDGGTYCTAVFTDSAGCAAVCAAAGLDCAEVWENVDGMCAADTGLAELTCDPPTGHQSDFCMCVGSGTPSTGGAPGTGGTSSGGAPATGGVSATGGVDGTGGTPPVTGDLTIFDPVPGFASVAGGTTGGGTDLGSAIVVSSMGDLQNAAGGSDSAIILVEPGTYFGQLSVGANKTIIGLGPGVLISGNLEVSGSDSYNVIIRNIAVQGLPCGSYDECRDGDDAVYIGNAAHHVWLDHIDVSDGQDGNCDMTREADYITVSWAHFHYTYDKEHRFSNLIAGGDGETQSDGKLRITYMNSHWGERVDSRQPRGRFGDIHMLNNYHNTGGGQIHGVGYDMALIAESSVYDENRSIWTDMGSPRGWQGIGNIGSGDDLNDSYGSVFTIPYSYTAMPADQVVDAVTSPSCGAGNTCTFQH